MRSRKNIVVAKIAWWVTAIGVTLIATWWIWLPRLDLMFAHGVIGSIMGVVGALFLDEYYARVEDEVFGVIMDSELS